MIVGSHAHANIFAGYHPRSRTRGRCHLLLSQKTICKSIRIYTSRRQIDQHIEGALQSEGK